jgi:PEP-CTERM motif
MTLSRFTAFAASALLASGAATAQIIDIDGTPPLSNSVSFSGLAFGFNGTFTGSSLALGPGSYTVNPIDTSMGGAYTAVNRFGGVGLPDTGWEWSLWIQRVGIDAAPVFYGFGVGIGALAGDYQSTAAGAFAVASALSPITFSLVAPTTVNFLWFDDSFGDNQGGISVSVVPEPATLALMAAGLGLVGAAARRQRARQALGAA